MAAGLSRGDIFRVRLPGRRGHRQSGARYGVILQADELVALSTVIVAPTSRSAVSTLFRPQIEVAGRKTHLLTEQMQALDVSHLGDKAGHLRPRELLAVDEAIQLVLGLR